MVKITVVSAAPLSATNKRKITEAFAKRHGVKVDAVFELDASLIGGILVIDGGEYFDASIKGRLVELAGLLQ